MFPITFDDIWVCKSNISIFASFPVSISTLQKTFLFLTSFVNVWFILFSNDTDTVLYTISPTFILPLILPIVTISPVLAV